MAIDGDMQPLFEAEPQSSRNVTRRVGQTAPAALMRRLAAMLAPMASNSGALVDDDRALEVANAVCAAFGTEDAVAGLSYEQIVARVGDRVPRELLDSRLRVFRQMGLLRPFNDKRHQQRLVLSSAGWAGLLCLQRLGREGGLQELLSMLRRTADAIRAGTATEQVVAEALEEYRSTLAIFTNEVLGLVANSPIEELVRERATHEHGDALGEVLAFNELVNDEFPALDAPAYRLVREGQRYNGAIQALMDRVQDQAAASRNFDYLDPEQYLSAAIMSGADALAGVCADVLFDAACPWLDAGGVVEAIEHYTPRGAPRQRPPAGEAPPHTDPMDRHDREIERRVRRRALRAEQFLAGADRTEMTEHLRGAQMPAAAQIVGDLLALDSDHNQPYRLAAGDGLLVDPPPGPVTYVAQLELRRTPPDTPAAAARGQEGEETRRAG